MLDTNEPEGSLPAMDEEKAAASAYRIAVAVRKDARKTLLTITKVLMYTALLAASFAGAISVTHYFDLSEGAWIGLWAIQFTGAVFLIWIVTLLHRAFKPLPLHPAGAKRIGPYR